MSTLKSCVLISLLLLALPRAVWSGEERLHPPPYVDEICYDLETTLEVMQCLAKYIEDAKARLHRTNSLLLAAMEPTDDDRNDPFKSYGEDIENYKKANMSWENSVEYMCGKFILRYWFPGSIYKTKTLECEYEMYFERNKFIRNQFRNFFESKDPYIENDK